MDINISIKTNTKTPLIIYPNIIIISNTFTLKNKSNNQHVHSEQTLHTIPTISFLISRLPLTIHRQNIARRRRREGVS